MSRIQSAAVVVCLSLGCPLPAQLPRASAARPVVMLAAPGAKLAATSVAHLHMDVEALSKTYKGKTALGFMPNKLQLGPTKPAGIKKEPAYAGAVRYGVITAGTGPKAKLAVAADDKNLYVDANGNGDLTDDVPIPLPMEGDMKVRTVRTSYGTPATETASGLYSFGFYGSGQTGIWYTGQAGLTGNVTIAGKPHKALLVDMGPDANFARPTSPKGKRDYPVVLVIDLDDKGELSPYCPTFDTRKPFIFANHEYRFSPSQDGTTLTVRDLGKPAVPPPPPAPPMLTAGKPAPDFTVLGPDGAKAMLSSLRGKVVVLDWWATWCGPCKASMPHLEHLWEQLKGRDDAVILAVCAFDERAKFDDWVKTTKYTFPIYFDPAGMDRRRQIPSNKYGVTGIPTTFVIGKDGVILDVIVGYSGEKDHRLDDALAKAGLKVE